MNQPRKDNGQFGPFPTKGTSAESEEVVRQKRQAVMDGVKAHDQNTKAWHKRNVDRAFGNPTVEGN